MAKKNLKSLVLIQGNENLVSQNYLDTTLKVRTLKSHMRVGRSRVGVLTMVEDDELFEFVEQLTSARWSRNPLVFRGEYINIHRDKNGHYQIALRKTELSKWCNVVRLGNAITTELLTAKKVLGVCAK